MSDIKIILKTWDKVDCVKFAVWCAEKIILDWQKIYPDDQRPQVAVMAAKNWIDNPPAANMRRMHDAVTAASEAGDSAHNYDLDCVAYAASDACGAALDNDYSYVYAGNAAFWAKKALYDEISEKDLLNEYMSLVEPNTISLFELNKGL